MITYRTLKFVELLDNGIAKMLDKHFEELSDKQYKLEPDYKKYTMLCDNDMLWCCGVFDEDKMVGYAVYLINSHLHYASAKIAYEDVYYLMPEYRIGYNGINLFKFIESELRAIGCSKMITGTKVKREVGIILKRLGHKHFENLYSKKLG